MLSEKLFENIFAAPGIIDTRLAAFAADTVNRVAHLDTGAIYKAIATQIADAGSALQEEISGVDRHVNTRMGKTDLVESATGHFRSQMRVLEGVIAHAVGGFGSEGYLVFYPFGVSEYHSARIHQIPTLLDRVHAAAETYGDQLGADLKAKLQGFKADWHSARDYQERAKVAVSGSRTQRGSARHRTEIALLTLVHEVAKDHPGDVAACSAWFDFSLLYAPVHGARHGKQQQEEDGKQSAAQ